MKKKTAERIYETTSYGPTTALEGVLGVGERKKGVENFLDLGKKTDV